VFQKVFGYAKSKAEKLMLDVHHKGKAVVSNGTREEMERHAEILHGYGLWATVSHDR
jgi:ATP-dependent Clp protease adaptor protein ClpS